MFNKVSKKVLALSLIQLTLLSGVCSSAFSGPFSALLGRAFSSKVNLVIQETLGMWRPGPNMIRGESSQRLTLSEAYLARETWLGPGFREVGERGVFQSEDGTRQWRMDPDSLEGNHSPFEPHFHLEWRSPKGRKFKVNNHILLDQEKDGKEY